LRYHIRHETQYGYSADVVHSHQLLHLVPRPASYQQCIEHTLEVVPGLHERRDQVDVFGNPMTSIELEHPHRRLEVVADMEVEVFTRPVVLAGDGESWESVRDSLAYRAYAPPSRERLEAAAFRHESAYVHLKRAFIDYAADCFEADRPVLACADALSAKLHREFRYAPGETTIGTPLTEVLAHRRGVCQDFAHLMIACLRSRGLAARYVSGYVRRLFRSAEPAVQSAPAAGASHAWVAVYCPPLGWVELDPTNDTRVAGDHVSVAWGRDFGDVSPLRGVILGGGEHRLSVSVTVTPLTAS
jgi:transglutaminase-like putative cysteine protease